MLALYEDETALATTWRIPATHEYETWGDVRAFDGTATIQQPQVRPLYGGHSPHEVLAIMLGDLSSDDYKPLRGFWQQQAEQENRGDFEAFWHSALQSGVVSNTAAPVQLLTPAPTSRLSFDQLRRSTAAAFVRCFGRMKAFGTGATPIILGYWRCRALLPG